MPKNENEETLQIINGNIIDRHLIHTSEGFVKGKWFVILTDETTGESTSIADIETLDEALAIARKTQKNSESK